MAVRTGDSLYARMCMCVYVKTMYKLLLLFFFFLMAMWVNCEDDNKQTHNSPEKKKRRFNGRKGKTEMTKRLTALLRRL